MKNILVPVDFSKPSENALRVAAKLAQRNNAKIHVLHVIELAESLFGAEQFNVDDEQIIFFMKLAKKKFSDFLDKDFLKDIETNDLVEVGSATFGIKEAVKDQDIDLIIMGSNGASGLEEVLIGSNTEKVVRHSNVPVLVVKHDIENLDFKTVLFATDFELENVEAYNKAKTFADSFGAKMKLVYVNLPGNQFYSTSEVTNHMRNFLNEVQVPLNHENIIIYNDYTIEQGVLNAANNESAELIAMPTHGRKGLSHFFNGSIGEDVVNHSDLPVITFKI
ncbi:Nucleotide-binding universal stress protein, UspA family [Psychroflexus salarius]|uniref:Nucleotide-binding universal stress protein, UspA family n=1 Tax=Psychroflexus salarius TaxID=1155689 RepID=A0A1M4T909_9FLAO|nr:universal stress protein [Psychroflexus salarius]SHE40905.1 Nucleotide-binding universal stress protein, UspA family [Psychroflexus salarius]